MIEQSSSTVFFVDGFVQQNLKKNYFYFLNSIKIEDEISTYEMEMF